MISQPTEDQVNRNTCYQHFCGLLKGTMETALFPHGITSTGDIFLIYNFISVHLAQRPQML